MYRSLNGDLITYKECRQWVRRREVQQRITRAPHGDGAVAVLWVHQGLSSLWSLSFCPVHVCSLQNHQLSLAELGMLCCKNTTFCSEYGNSLVLAAEQHTQYK